MDEETLLGECRQLQESGAGTESIVRFLREQGLSRIQSMAFLARKLNFDLDEAKAIVHGSATWEDTREDTERFLDQLEEGIEEAISASDGPEE